MKLVNITKARMRLSQLVDIAASGKDVVVSRHGKRLVRIAQLASRRGRRIKFGVLKGKLKIAPGFDVPLSGDVLSVF